MFSVYTKQEKFENLTISSVLRSRFSGCHAMLPQKREERCVTSQKTAAKETKQLAVISDLYLRKTPPLKSHVSWRRHFRKAPFSKRFPSTPERQSQRLKFLWFEVHFRKAAFSWRVSVDGRPNRRNKAAFSNSSGVGYCRFVDEKGHSWKRRRKLAKFMIQRRLKTVIPTDLPDDK